MPIELRMSTPSNNVSKLHKILDTDPDRLHRAAARRMAAHDALPREWRQLVYEYSTNTVTPYHEDGYTPTKALAALKALRAYNANEGPLGAHRIPVRISGRRARAGGPDYTIL